MQDKDAVTCLDCRQPFGNLRRRSVTAFYPLRPPCQKYTARAHPNVHIYSFSYTHIPYRYRKCDVDPAPILLHAPVPSPRVRHHCRFCGRIFCDKVSAVCPIKSNASTLFAGLARRCGHSPAGRRDRGSSRTAHRSTARKNLRRWRCRVFSVAGGNYFGGQECYMFVSFVSLVGR